MLSKTNSSCEDNKKPTQHVHPLNDICNYFPCDAVDRCILNEVFDVCSLFIHNNALKL
jgi:hypothetical protein